MKRSSRMTIQQATQDYEKWLATELEIVPADLELKHERMRQAIFSFLRATYYRWAQQFPHVCRELCRAPQVLAVGDLHVENFGTWRDAEGRLVWGINDFDETWRLPYTHDLVRLATSAHLAIADGHLVISGREACETLLAGYREGLEANGRPFVLAEHSAALREMATRRLRDPQAFWDKLSGLQPWKGEVPPRVVRGLSDLLPRPDLPRRIVHRVAGLGSLGRQRFVAIADWQGGKIAREAKALAPSAAVWAFGGEGITKVLYREILEQSVRSVDPWVKVRRRWILRRLAPDCSRIELSELPEEREESRLLRAMGWETANVHLGSRSAHGLLLDLAAREGDWLHEAAKAMLAVVEEDWESWRKHPVAPGTSLQAVAADAALRHPHPAAATADAEAAEDDDAAGSSRDGRGGKDGKGGKAGKGGKDGKGGKGAKGGKAAKAASQKNAKGGARKAAKTASQKTAKVASQKSAKAGSRKSAKAGSQKSAKAARDTAAGDGAAPGARSAKPAKKARPAEAEGLPGPARAAGAGKPGRSARAGKQAKAGKSAKKGKAARAGKQAQGKAGKRAGSRGDARSAKPAKPGRGADAAKGGKAADVVKDVEAPQAAGAGTDATAEAGASS